MKLLAEVWFKDWGSFLAIPCATVVRITVVTSMLMTVHLPSLILIEINCGKLFFPTKGTRLLWQVVYPGHTTTVALSILPYSVVATQKKETFYAGLT